MVPARWRPLGALGAEMMVPIRRAAGACRPALPQSRLRSRRAEGAVMTGRQRRIVVGVDGSDSSKAALRWAILQTKLTSGSVDAVTAWALPVHIRLGAGRR